MIEFVYEFPEESSLKPAHVEYSYRDVAQNNRVYAHDELVDYVNQRTKVFQSGKRDYSTLDDYEIPKLAREVCLSSRKVSGLNSILVVDSPTTSGEIGDIVSLYNNMLESLGFDELKKFVIAEGLPTFEEICMATYDVELLGYMGISRNQSAKLRVITEVKIGKSFREITDFMKVYKGKE